jgi:predicted lipoprotein with Yx(FWY)xxD motif
MTQHRTARFRSFSSLLAMSAMASTAMFSACAEDPEGLFDPAAGAGGGTGAIGGTGSGEAGDGPSATAGTDTGSAGKGTGAVGNGGSKASGGTGSGGRGGSSNGGKGGGSTATGGTGATEEGAGMGGDDGSGGEEETGGTNSTGGTAGDGVGGSSAGTSGAGQGGSGPLSCVYSSAPVPEGQGGTAGTGGTTASGGSAGNGAPVYDINVRVSPTLGKYLADANGMTLYFRTSDLPGDCQPDNPPISRCTLANGACSTTWPPYNAGERTLDPQLDPDAFGTIQREDGTHQTTYQGWPLYLYTSDTAAGQTVGQGKAKVWFAAEMKLPNVVIMQEGSVKYLADITGRTLYASSADVLGTDTADPVSNCDDTCLQTYEPFRAPRLYPVQALEPDDFTSFVNPAGPLQIAYKGAPLYRARTDMQGGDQTGVSGTFALVLP